MKEIIKGLREARYAREEKNKNFQKNLFRRNNKRIQIINQNILLSLAKR